MAQGEHLQVPGTASGAAATAGRVDRLDRQLAWVAMFGPFAGTALAVALLVVGWGPGWVGVGLLFAMYALTMAGLEVGYHRYFAHRSFRAKEPVAVALGILGSMAFQGPVIWWAATHRRHHSTSDTVDDPHSPYPRGPGLRGRLRGLYEAHWGWLFRADRTRPAGWEGWAKDLYRNEAIFNVHMRYLYWPLLSLVIPTLLGGLLTWSWQGGVMGLLWGGFVRMFLVDHGLRGITSVTHAFGSRPYATEDLSTNNLWMVIPTFGQGWHNNHHAFPHSAIMSRAWWQIDIGAWIIRALERLGLVWDVKTDSDESDGDAPRRARLVGA